MIGRLLTLAPWWAWLLAAAALLATGAAGGYAAGSYAGQLALRTEQLAHEIERSRAAEIARAALAAEITTHNALQATLEADHARHDTERAALRAQAASATVALAAADRSAGRLRDASETNRLATAAALEAAGATGQCSAATEAADLLRWLLARYRAKNQELADAGRAVSLDADNQHGAASECAGWADAVIMDSGSPPP